MRDSPEERQDKSKQGNNYALEICFLTCVGLVALAAFADATSYEIVSSRTPFVIMGPLFLLIAIQAIRLRSARHDFNPRRRISEALTGRIPDFNMGVRLCGLMVGLVFMIWILGHYAGAFLFCLIVMRLAGEEWVLSACIAAITTLFIYGVFELLFDIRMYRGLIIRHLLGFRVFDF